MYLKRQLVLLLATLTFLISQAHTTQWIQAGFWSSDRGFPISTINSSAFTHLLCGFSSVDPSTFKLSISPTDAESFSLFTSTVRSKNPSVATLLSIRCNTTNFDTFSILLTNSSFRESFINSSVEFARNHGFHGLDLIWSCPVNANATSASIGQLFDTWRDRIDQEAAQSAANATLLLTATLSFWPIPVQSVNRSLDWVHLRASEYHSPKLDESTTAAHAAVYDPNGGGTDAGVKEWIGKGLPASKMVLSIPLYGYAWKLRVEAADVRGVGTPAEGAAISRTGFFRYADVRRFVEVNRAEVYYNGSYVVNYCWAGLTWIGYDDVEAVREKVEYARRMGLRGYAIWQIPYDDNGTLSQVAGRGERDAASVLAGEIKEKNPRMVAVPYSFRELEKATDEFCMANKLGQGGYGPVYKGVLADGGEIAVKKLSTNSSQGDDEFKNEVILTAQLQHINLVRVLGFCIDAGERMLVYEYLPGNSLDQYLFDPVKSLMLDWTTRVEIIEGVTQGLLYLQDYSGRSIIHRDLKPGNVLLDSNMKAKISDFGMARILKIDSTEANTERIAGTRAYCPPEYLQKGQYSKKSDVYSFGILLLQIISGKRCVPCYGPHEDLELHVYAYELWKEGKGREIMDPSLDDTNSACKLITCLKIALLCVQRKPRDRPRMRQVSSMLRDDQGPGNAIQNVGIKDVRASILYVSSPTNHASPALPRPCSPNHVTITELLPRS
ncbi:Cysteine-rich receptor-like protein kinase 10 [Linum grandiflorum]